MGNTPPGEFSFDLYPGLDADLQAAYDRNVQQGNASPEAVATAGIAAAVNDTLSQIQPNTQNGTTAEVVDWAKQELEAPDGALQEWSKYQRFFGIDVPDSLGKLTATSPNLAPTLQRLYEAKQALTASGEVTPSGGENIGETMNLVMVPWQIFKDNLGDIEALLQRLRGIQGVETDAIGPNIINAIKNNTPFYKSWYDAGALYTAADYLDHKIDQDGPWGVMLAQTSDEPGAKSFHGQSPDEITREFDYRPEIAGQAVGSMGLFEWLAVTLQGNPKQISSQFYTWMLANRIDRNGDPTVPFGSWRGARVYSRLWGSVDRGGHARPRLAVM